MIVVFGSLNVDFVTRVSDLPTAGTTVMGQSYQLFAGGKGANQALAAARAGAGVHMVGAVGTDGFADVARAALAEAGVSLGRLAQVEEPTGAAFVAVDRQGRNQIIVAAGANARAKATQLEGLDCAGGGWLLVQREIPEGEIAAAVRWAKAQGLRVALNLAPSGAAPLDLITQLDLLILNEHEAADLCAQAGLRPAEEAKALASRLAAFFGCDTVITLGEAGAVACVGGQGVSAPALPVRPLDTTAAGDAFCGALLAALDQGASFAEALAQGCVAGSLACLVEGAQPSLPSKEAILARLQSPLPKA